MTIKLPKQWKHWVSRANLRIVDYYNRKPCGYYLKGRGFHWRVNCYGEFERGDTYDEFDRWALCTIDSCLVTNIKTYQDFVDAVELLIGSYKEE